MTKNKISITQRRFMDGTPETKFISDGATVRCQAVAKGKLERLRMERGDPTLTPEDVWPEAQCEHAAVPGKLLCGGRGGHGGGSPSVPVRDLLDFLPFDLREKVEILIQHPQIISRRFEIIMLAARNLQIQERIRDNQPDGPATTNDLERVYKMLGGGEVVEAQKQLREIIDSRHFEEQGMAEFRANTALLKDLARTETANMKEFQEMASSDQVLSLLQGLVRALGEALEKYVIEPQTRSLVLGYYADATERLAHARSLGYGPGAQGDGGQDGGDAQPVDAEALLHS